MTEYVLGVKSGTGNVWGHDPSAVLFRDGQVVFGSEEERYTRDKHAVGKPPKNSIEAALQHSGISISSISNIAVPFNPALVKKSVAPRIRNNIHSLDVHPKSVIDFSREVIKISKMRMRKPEIKSWLQNLLDAEDIPQISFYSHHRSHAASAFYPAEFQEAIILTIDGYGEHDSTVVWRADQTGLERIQT